MEKSDLLEEALLSIKDLKDQMVTAMNIIRSATEEINTLKNKVKEQEEKLNNYEKKVRLIPQKCQVFNVCIINEGIQTAISQINAFLQKDVEFCHISFSVTQKSELTKHVYGSSLIYMPGKISNYQVHKFSSQSDDINGIEANTWLKEKGKDWEIVQHLAIPSPVWYYWIIIVLRKI